MKYNRLFAGFLGLFALISFSSSNINETSFVSAETENLVVLNAQNEATIGQYFDAEIFSYISNENVNSLCVEFYYDSNIFSLSNIVESNEFTNSLFDYNSSEGSLKISYLFLDYPLLNGTSLINFTIEVLETAETGDYVFDIFVTECYDDNFESIDVKGVSKKIKISLNDEQPEEFYEVLVSQNIYKYYVQYDETFTYILNTYLPDGNAADINSGTFTITYDPELLDVVDIYPSEQLQQTLYDVKDNGNGEINISFVSANLDFSIYEIISINYKAIKNQNVGSQINIEVKGIYNYNLEPALINIVNPTIYLQIESVFDPVDLKLVSSLDATNSTITIDVVLESDANLGAGDFTISFNQSELNYVSHTVCFKDGFLMVNTKEQTLQQGKIKFSLVSTKGINVETKLLSITFGYESTTYERNLSFAITGDRTTDPLTNAISLDYVGTEVFISGIESKEVNISLFAYKEENIAIYVNLNTEANLGAGDFTISFNKNVFTFLKSEIYFDTDFFLINDKNANEGEISFSILDVDGVPFAGDILKLEFKAANVCSNGVNAEFIISGTNVADNLTNLLPTTYSNTNIFIEGSGDHSWTKYYYDGNNIHYSNCDFCNSRISGFCKNVVIDEGDATCQKEGTRILECSLCHNTSTENYYGDHELISSGINEGDTMITYHCKHCDYTEERSLSLMYLSSRNNFFFRYIGFDNEITIYLTKGDTFQILLDYSYKIVNIFGASGIDDLGDNLYECSSEGAYRFYYSKDSDIFFAENANSSNDLMLDRANSFKEKLRLETEEVYICDEGGVIDEKFETLVQIVEEYQNMSLEMKNIIDPMHCFGDYTCYDVLTIVTRGLMKAGWTNNSLSNHYYVQIVKDNESILMFSVISFIALASLVSLIINKKKRT